MENAVIKGGGLEKYWTETEMFRCDQGNDALAKKLAVAVGEGRIHLNTPVERIISKHGGIEVRSVTGHTFVGDQVVLAIPPSVWSKITIEPALPASLTPQMGTNVKFLSKMNRRAWEPAAASALMSGAISETWDGTDHQPGLGYCLVGFAGGDAAREAQQLYAEGGRRALIRTLVQAYP